MINKDPDGLAPIYIQNQGTNNNGKEPYIIKQGDEQYFIRNGAEPVYSNNGDNYYITSGKIEIKELPNPTISGMPSISSPGYEDDSYYAIDNIYHINNYITNSNTNTRFIPPKENQIGNITLIGGIGVGFKVDTSSMNVSIGAQVRYAGEVDMFYKQELRGVYNASLKALGSGISMNDDILNKRRYEEYSLLYFSTKNNDIIVNVGIELYMIIGGGFSATLNLSEVMRRASRLFKGGCNRDD